MPQTEGAMSLTAEDEVELVKAAAKLSRNKGSFKAKLTRQTPVEMSEKRQVLKQESKDSGIVTEMFVRPKENKHSSDNLKEYARQESKSEKKKSLAKRSQSMKIKRTQSCKVKGEREREYLERTHDDSEVSYFFNIARLSFQKSSKSSLCQSLRNSGRHVSKKKRNTNRKHATWCSTISGTRCCILSIMNYVHIVIVWHIYVLKICS